MGNVAYCNKLCTQGNNPTLLYVFLGVFVVTLGALLAIKPEFCYRRDKKGKAVFHTPAVIWGAMNIGLIFMIIYWFYLIN